MNERKGKIETVTGLILPSELGFTHSHEHILFDYFKMIKSYDVIFDEEVIAENELNLYKHAGGDSLIDCSSSGIGTNPESLSRLSHKTGVNIVLGCGWYRESVYEDIVYTKSASDLSEILQTQILDGFKNTGVKAGFIGEIGTERDFIGPAQERVFSAAAKASLATGVAVLTHTTHFGELAIEQVNLLEEAGMNPERILISHLGDREDTKIILEVAKRGVYLSIDNIGYISKGYPPDEVRINSILTLIEAGYLDKIVLGTDICTRSALKAYGGRGFVWLLESFIPKLLSLGISQMEVETMMKLNIAKAMTII
jgi:phosphotriesterase-related protein